MDWPQALRDYRRRHLLTQEALAEILNVDPTSVSRWERGRDTPALWLQRRLKSLVLPATSNIEEALRALIDSSDDIVVLFDNKHRLLRSSAKHRALLRLDASDLYGRSYERFHSESQAALHAAFGGQHGWWSNGILKCTHTFIRKPFERANNPQAYAQRGIAWAIRDGVESPMILGVTREIPVAEYVPNDFAFTTLDDPLA